MPSSKSKSGFEQKVVNCSVPGCKRKKQFYFPKNETLRAKWLKAIRREHFNPRQATHGLCSAHFSPHDIMNYVDPDISRERTRLRRGSIPSIFPWNEDAQCLTSGIFECYEEVVMSSKENIDGAEYSTDPTSKSEHSLATHGVAIMDTDSMDNLGAVINQNVPESCDVRIIDHLGYCLAQQENDSNHNMPFSTEPREQSPMIVSTGTHSQFDDANYDNGGPQQCQDALDKDEYMTLDCYEEIIPLGTSITDGVIIEDQTCNDDCIGDKVSSNIDPSSNKYSNTRYSIEQFRDRPDLILHLTGLENYKKFELVLLSLGSAAYHLKYVRKLIGDISVPNQFFLVLWKLRRNECDLILGTHFGIDRLAVGNIFITWILFMSQHWDLIDLWPSRDLVDFFLPENFKRNYPKTRVIIDGTEFEIEKPSDPRAQQSSFSNYKNRNTGKAVLGCTGGGLISYCSPVYGGSTSDRQIVERSDLMKRCDPGDIVMADKGFSVQDLFAPYNVTCMTPTFVKKGYLSHATVMRDRRLAKHRIHIERVIGLVKTFTILKSKLNHNYVPLASEIVKVCVMLSNFKENIMQPKKGKKMADRL